MLIGGKRSWRSLPCRKDAEEKRTDDDAKDKGEANEEKHSSRWC